MAAGLASEAAVETFIYLSGGGTIWEYLSLFLSVALPDRSLSCQLLCPLSSLHFLLRFLFFLSQASRETG